LSAPVIAGAKKERLPISKRPGISLIQFAADKIGTRRLEAATQSSDCSAETSEVSTEAAEAGTLAGE